MRTTVAIAIALSLAACHRQAKPDPRVDELARRVQTIEENQQRILAVLEGLEKLAEVAATLDERASSIEQTAEALDEAMRGVQRRLRDGGGAARARPTPRPRRKRPAPDVVYAVPIAGDPYDGPKHAKVTIVMGFEYTCPYCQRVRKTLDALKKQYAGDIRIVYKDYIVHPQRGTLPAKAACAAQEQGHYLAMHERLWQHLWPHQRRDADRNTEDAMKELARDIGLDVARFDRDLNGSACRQEIREDQEQLKRIGVRGTPSFFINGRFLSGAQPIENFQKIIDEELAKTEEALKRGVPLERYYRKQVLDKGRKKL